MKKRNPFLQSIQGFWQHHFHSVEAGPALLVAVLLVLYHWFSIETHLLLEGLPGFWKPGLTMVVPLVALGCVWLLARMAAGGRLHLTPRNRPENTYEAIILFLSPPLADEPRIGAENDPVPVHGSIRDDSTRKFFQGPWRMPVESIGSQIDKLRRVVVLPSADRPGSKDGSIHFYRRFCEVVRPLIRGAGREDVEIQLVQGHRWENGVDFLDMNAFADAMEDALRQLESQGISRRDTVVDITGGYGVLSAVGALSSAAARCEFAWIDGKSYRMKAFRAGIG